jgi:hypothetical protein
MDNKKNNPEQDGMNNQNHPQNQKHQNQNDQSFDNQNKNQQTPNNHDQNDMDREGEATTNTNKDGRSEEHQTNQDEKRYTGSKNPDGMDTNVSNRDKDFNKDITNGEDRNKNLEE